MDSEWIYTHFGPESSLAVTAQAFSPKNHVFNEIIHYPNFEAAFRAWKTTFSALYPEELLTESFFLSQSQ